MGYDAEIVFPTTVRFSEVAEFLGILGYFRRPNVKKCDPDMKIFHYYKDDSYKYFEGVVAVIGILDNEQMAVWTHTSTWCSYFDIEFQNFTIRQLKKRFGGTFKSDQGVSRYLKFDGIVREGAEAGCWLARSELDNGFSTAQQYLSVMVEGDKPVHCYIPDEFNPVILGSNLILTYIVSMIEDYFRANYIALLKYSNKKSNIFKNLRPHSDDLVAVSNGTITIEEAVARTLSFQNIQKISINFRDLDSRIDIQGTLKAPYKRRKESLYDTLHRILEHRHSLIHRKFIDDQYGCENAKKDIKHVEYALERVYQHLIQVFKWQ